MWQLHHAQISQFVTVNQLPKYVEFLNPQQVGLVRSWTQLTDTPPFSWSSPSQVDRRPWSIQASTIEVSLIILFPILGAGVWSNEPQVLITLSHFSATVLQRILCHDGNIFASNAKCYPASERAAPNVSRRKQLPVPTTTPTALLYFSPHCPACHLSYTLDEAPTRSPYAAAPPHQPNALFGTQISKGTKTTLYFLFTSITKHAVLSSIVLSRQMYWKP